MSAWRVILLAFVANRDSVVKHVHVGGLHAVRGDERVLDAILATRAVDLGIELEHAFDDGGRRAIRPYGTGERSTTLRPQRNRSARVRMEGNVADCITPTTNRRLQPRATAKICPRGLMASGLWMVKGAVNCVTACRNGRMT